MRKIVLLILLFISTQTVYAVESEKINLQTQAVNPGDFYYSAKRLWEKIAVKFYFNNDARFKYSNSLIDKRISELMFVAKNKRLDEAQRSTERLSYQIGVLTDDLIKQGDENKKEQFKTRINSFLPVLSDIRDIFPSDTSFRMLVQHDINSIKLYADKLSK